MSFRKITFLKPKDPEKNNKLNPVEIIKRKDSFKNIDLGIEKKKTIRRRISALPLYSDIHKKTEYLKTTRSRKTEILKPVKSDKFFEDKSKRLYRNSSGKDQRISTRPNGKLEIYVLSQRYPTIHTNYF